MPMSFFKEIEKENLRIHMEVQDPEQPKQSWAKIMMMTVLAFLISSYITDHNNKNSMALAQTQIHKPME